MLLVITQAQAVCAIFGAVPKRVPDLKKRILQAAAQLLTQGGRAAVSTRAVSAAAGVQAPTIYRQFHDMDALLQAAALEVFGQYVQQKRKRRAGKDPIEELARGWDMHVAFGVANPAAFAMIYGAPAMGENPPELLDGYTILEALVTRIAQAGKLRVSVAQATRMIHAAACGVTFALIGSPPEERDEKLSQTMRDLVLGAIIEIVPAEPATKTKSVASRAVALQAVLSDASGVLTTGEQHLLNEWLDRLSM